MMPSRLFSFRSQTSWILLEVAQLAEVLLQVTELQHVLVHQHDPLELPLRVLLLQRDRDAPVRDVAELYVDLEVQVDFVGDVPVLVLVLELEVVYAVEVDDGRPCLEQLVVLEELHELLNPDVLAVVLEAAFNTQRDLVNRSTMLRFL